MSVFFRTCAVLGAALLFVFSAQAQSPENQLPLADGLIKKVDARTGTLLIAHGTIPNLNMPPMTMSFKAKDPAMLGRWKEGDKIRFRSAEVQGALTVVSIEAAQ